MHELSEECPFRCALSLKPLVDFWRNEVAGSDACCASSLQEMERELDMVPELVGTIADRGVLKQHEHLVRKLMSVVFPSAFWETDYVGAMVPFTLEPFLVSPSFERLLLNGDGTFRGRLHIDQETFRRARLIRFYLLILKRCYGLEKDLDYPLIRIVQDPETGLERYLRLRPELRFVEVQAAEFKRLSDTDLATILEHLAEPEILSEFLPPENFTFHGFTVMHAVDVTHTAVVSELERDLISEGTLFSRQGFSRVQDRLRALFGHPQLTVGLAAIQGDQVLMLTSGCEMVCNCFFSDSRHVTTSEFEGSVLHHAVQTKGILRIRDLREVPFRTRIDEEFLEAGIRSLLIAPLYDCNELIGVLNLGAPISAALAPTDEILASHILPLFSVAVKRALYELNNQVQSIIKEKCTAVHSSVEWRFRQAVFRHLERVARGLPSDLEPIVFRDVFPLYGAADIRGSSEARNAAIQADLLEHLSLGLNVVSAPGNSASIPILQELAYRLERQMEIVEKGLGSGMEKLVLDMLHREIEPLFSFISGLGPEAAAAVEAYRGSMDAHLATVYRRRKEFETSVALLNERAAAYLDREEAEAQAMFPHYFDKHQTDGVSYVMYMGSSMAENGGFNELYVRNLRLWQLMVSCGIAWQTEQLKKSFTNSFDTTHLILIHHSPLSIRFRFDEKRFDVDGAYDIGHEIIRSRVDKALVKGGEERLTQPGQIAVVYSRPEEGEEMIGYCTFLQNQGYLVDGLEMLELDDLPGVQGLKALRVRVNLDSDAIAERVRRLTLGS
ncbi:MAG TPA: GAF domain-containing protein [Desulfomonilaceae bacterium]|nr:GAF domain-containing protein [Desulfomonilaceae bacterium]